MKEKLFWIHELKKREGEKKNKKFVRAVATGAV